MKQNKDIRNAFFINGLSIGATWIKAKIHTSEYKNRNKKTLDESIEELQQDLIDLEIKSDKKDQSLSEKHRVYSPTDWETINDSVNRGKSAPQRGWIVPGIISEGSICNIQAAEKSGKSILVTQIAHDCAYNLISKLIPVTEEKASKQEVFVYDAELDDDDMVERYASIEDDRVLRCCGVYFDSPTAFVDHMELTVSRIDSNVLIIVDNISAVCPNFSGNDVNYIRSRIKVMQDKFSSKGYRLTIIFVHHTKIDKDGSGKDDMAGSKMWTRLAKLNLALSNTDYGNGTKKLSVVSGRGKTSLLSSDEAFLVKMVETPYPHFEFVKTILGVDGSATKGVDSNAPEHVYAPRSWGLTEEEKVLAVELYVPNQYGAERIAKNILLKRGLSTDSKSVGNMKSAVTRTLKQVGVYQQQKK